MLAIYREFKNVQTDTTELDMHLERCEDCRGALACYNAVGERLRSLPLIEPAPDAHAKMMQALAAEHVRFLQRSSSRTSLPTPDFLKPYLKEPISATEALAAFSSAETGPLPIVQSGRRASYTRHSVILGLAAMLLLVALAGGLTSLLLLANRGPVSNQNQASISQQSQVASVQYATTTMYTHIASAVADRQYIYYTAYNSGAQQWMLLQMNRATRGSTPLLSTPSASKLVVLGSTENRLVWLQLDPAKSVARKFHPRGASDVVYSWSLHSLDLTQPKSQVILLSSTFNQSSVPGWVHTPVQGISFVQNTLLAATLDNAGNAHLYNCPLDSAGKGAAIELASASRGHILTSPTASSDGTAIYWGEEWTTDDGTMHGNVWTQQVPNGIQLLSDRMDRYATGTKHLFRADEMSFHPQVVHDTLFLLSTNSDATGQATSTATQMPQTVTPSATSSLSVTTKTDPAAYTTQTDEAIHGTLLAFALNSATPATVLDSDSLASALQGGTRFLLWQNPKGYQMYDAVARLPVTVYTALKDASLLTVNGDTAVWTIQKDNAANSATADLSTATFMAFNWPTKEP